MFSPTQLMLLVSNSTENAPLNPPVPPALPRRALKSVQKISEPGPLPSPAVSCYHRQTHPLYQEQLHNPHTSGQIDNSMLKSNYKIDILIQFFLNTNISE